MNAVRFSYAVASGYVVADSIHKGKQAAEVGKIRVEIYNC